LAGAPLTFAASQDRHHVPAGTAVPVASRGVIAILAWHEVQRLVASFRFGAFAVLLLGLLLLSALAASAKYRHERQVQAAEGESYAASLRGITVDDLAKVQHLALRPPWRLAFAVEGGQAATPDAYEEALSPLVPPRLRRTQGDDDRLPGPSPLDWMFAIRAVLSLAAFLLGYDAICGERRAGTLKLVLSYPIRPWKLLLGKLAALWICLAVPFVLGAALSGGLLAALGEVPLGSDDLVKAGLVALLGLWAAALFALAALVVSAAARSPATSLSVLALLWIGAVVVGPALGSLAAHRLYPIPTEVEVDQRMDEVQRRIASTYAGREGRWRGRQLGAADGYAWERESVPAETERRDRQEEVRRWVIERKLGQVRLARGLAAASSPPSLLADVAERLVGAGRWRDRAFLAQARAFHSDLADRVRSLDAADPASPHLLFFRGYLSRRPVAPADVPRFTFREIPAAQGVAAAAPALAALALETLVLAALAVYLLSRQEAG
jgi:ABC-2 type transport system permease protein